MNRTDDDDNLEDLLRRHAVRGPAPELRQRVMSLRAGRSFFWEAAAASLLVGACLVQMLTSRPVAQLAATPAPDLSDIRQTLLKDYSGEEVDLATITLASAAGLRPYLDIPTSPGSASTSVQEELR